MSPALDVSEPLAVMCSLAAGVEVSVNSWFVSP